jgi:polyisoprenoid-binding protein YceI
VAFPTGTHKFGPANASLRVKTYRQGMASKAGHDLVIEVTRWEATLSIAEDWTEALIDLTADSRSLEVREGLRGIKPLSEKDCAEIKKNIDEKVLRKARINFRSSRLEPSADGTLVTVAGNLEMGSETRPLTFELSVDRAGDLAGSAALTQSEWGIKPYSALMGALKVRDAIDVECAIRRPSTEN